MYILVNYSDDYGLSCFGKFDSHKEAKRQTGISNTTIGLVCKGKGKTAGGFVWKYKND